MNQLVQPLRNSFSCWENAFGSKDLRSTVHSLTPKVRNTYTLTPGLFFLLMCSCSSAKLPIKQHCHLLQKTAADGGDHWKQEREDVAPGQLKTIIKVAGIGLQKTVFVFRDVGGVEQGMQVRQNSSWIVLHEFPYL